MPKQVQSVPRNGPSQMRTNLELKHQFRFTSSSATATIITDITLLAACGVACNNASGTSARGIFQTVKLNKIEIWTPPASQGAAVTCSILWPSSNNSPSREITDTSVSVSTPAHVQSSPAPLSLSGFWQNGNAGSTLVTLTAPPGSIIDVWVSLVLADPSSAVTATLVGGTPGNISFCCLDSTTAATGIYTPVGLTIK